MISQANISPNTPMGANLISGRGATFRARSELLRWFPLKEVSSQLRSLPTLGFPVLVSCSARPQYLLSYVMLCELVAKNRTRTTSAAVLSRALTHGG